MKYFIVIVYLFSALGAFAQDQSSQGDEQPIVITNESIKAAKSKEILKTEDKAVQEEPGPLIVKDCTKAQSLLTSILAKDWGNVATYINFPIKRKFPLTKVYREDFLKNYKLLFDEDFLKPNTRVAKVGFRGCMINNGDIWVEEDNIGGKILTINYESFLSKKERFEKIKKYTKTLPEEYRMAEPELTCSTAKSIYTVFKIPKTANYLLQVMVKGKVTDFVINGKMKIEGSMRARYYRFTEDDTVLTISDSFSTGGFNIEAKKGERELYVRCNKY